ncbi:DUF4926 domain-containing protein [Dyadobacter sp. CY323]|uniref:DUF4926 domain-containing protein n=1 Tax=Dyadobacter sp. CY323 TaxID=2907302 RepID=UPI0021066F52|nr:DUF4926 domain-containing protein [Dyadobacter sp. CY323]
MISELDKVVLTENIYNYELKVGDVGAIVMIHGEDLGYEVEFIALDGDTIAVETLNANQIRAIRKG